MKKHFIFDLAEQQISTHEHAKLSSLSRQIIVLGGYDMKKLLENLFQGHSKGGREMRL